MQLNRFWSSVWSVVVLLFSVGLLQYLLSDLVTLFGLLRGPVAGVAQLAVAAFAPIAGTILFLDWRWNWKVEHIGFGRDTRAAWWFLGGLGGGAVAAYLLTLVSALLDGAGVAVVPALEPFGAVDLVFTLGVLFAAEVTFRGAVTSRYQADLTPREVLTAVSFTPLLGLLIWYWLGGPPTGMFSVWDYPMILALTLLYLRTNSVWLSAGLRLGLYAAFTISSLQASRTASVLVWAVVALLLLAMEWNKQQRMPKRVQPRPSQRGRTIRGPWGPH